MHTHNITNLDTYACTQSTQRDTHTHRISYINACICIFVYIWVCICVCVGMYMCRYITKVHPFPFLSLPPFPLSQEVTTSLRKQQSPLDHCLPPLYHLPHLPHVTIEQPYTCTYVCTHIHTGYNLSEGPDSPGLTMVYLLFAIFYTTKCGLYIFYKIAHRLDKVSRST